MKIFQLDDKKDEIQRLQNRLHQALGSSIEAYVTAQDYDTGIGIVRKSDFDLYILDGEFPNASPFGENDDTPFNAIRFIKELRQLKSYSRIIVYSGYGQAPKNRKAIREFDPNLPFYSKSEMEELVQVISEPANCN